MTIGQHVAALRGLIRQFSESEVPFSDEFLYHLFRAAANSLTRQKLDKNNKMASWVTDFYCIPTEVGKVHGCGCIKAGCDVVKSKDPIPKPMRGRYRDYIKVSTIDGESVGYVDALSWKSIQYDLMRKDKLHYSFVNKHIILWNADIKNMRPKAIVVSGYWEDPSEWSSITSCDGNGTSTNQSCFNVYESDYPIDSDLVDSAYSMVLDKLRVPLSIPEDKRNQTNQL
jgi:hypothetical protein